MVCVTVDGGAMVNTRRTESIGSTPEIGPQHRTRRSVPAAVDEDSSSGSDSDDSQGGDVSWELQRKSKPLLPKKEAPLASRVRELRNRFVYSGRQFSTSLHEEELKNRKRITLNDRHTIAVYTPRDMHDDSDVYNGNDSDDEMYSSRSRRSLARHLRSHMGRIERRTALSLRPISQKCYADPHSPLHFSDYEGTGVRRSKRQRKIKFENTSWLADDQMHKVGYPNLNSNAGYSEEDSHDAPEVHRETSRRSTRRSSDLTANNRREIKNPKYLYDYETTEVASRRRRSETNLLDRDKHELRTRRSSNDKENKDEAVLNGRHYTRSVKKEEVNNDITEDVSNQSSKDLQENGVDADPTTEVVKDDAIKTNENKRETSESDELPKLRTRNRNSNSLMMNRSYPSRRTRQTKRMQDDSSSSSEEEGPKGYSLRNRPPKPAPKTLRSHDISRSRRHFNRRRKDSSSSSDTSSSDIRHEKYSKTPQKPHSKNEQKMKSGAGGSKIIPIGPETLDSNLRFSSIGGLDSHVQCLKEMILLPMMYPEVFRQFQIQPPRGVLFHGPPGTGKTLIARALASECSFGCRKVSFFMRKGADLLSKWIGESEKQLRLLFEQAAEMQPSIIFFDELDGLAPVRSSRQDQVHASIVSTLLALMDGLNNRGEVIVIGATNRIDAIDPALRRPGRFDRELFFPLPAKSEREDILKVHVAQWSAPPNEPLLSYLAETAVGYCGSDLRALCTEAVIQGFRRTYPQVYNADHRLMLNPENVKVEKIDFLRAKSLLVPASHRVAQGMGRKLLPILEPLLGQSVKYIFGILEQSFPHGMNPTLAKVKLSPNIRPAQLLIVGENSDYGQTSHLAPAILYKMEHIHCYILDLATLYKETGRGPEETCLQVFNEARRNVPSIVYIPNIDIWWKLVSDTVQAILESQLSQLDPNIPILFLATADTLYENLSDETQNLFSRYRKEVYQVDAPDADSRKAFFKPLLIDSCLKPSRVERNRQKTPSPLPRAPTPPPAPLSEEQAKKLYEQEEHTLRELRIFLRDICRKLANNKLFYMFTKPVDTEEVPDYTTIIKQPMDLETMMTKVDFHRYESAKDFLNDIELICQNALEYNPAKTSADKQIRHRACSLRDYAYTLIKNEMDSDFEDKCQDIATKRLIRKASVQKYLPAYIQTPDNVNINKASEENQTEGKSGAAADKSEEKADGSGQSRQVRKRRLNGSWQKGFINSRKKRRIDKSIHEEEEKGSTDESKDHTLGPADSSLEVEDNQMSKSQTPTGPLSINCNPPTSISNHSLQSPVRRLSDLMSPSELLNNPLEFDDIDQALNEIIDHCPNARPIECAQAELERVLDDVVKVTQDCSLKSLLDLYNQLSRIVKKFSKTHRRNDLPKELSREVIRFQNEATPETLSEIDVASIQENEGENDGSCSSS